MKSIVKVWEEDVIIPTYGIGEPEKNPVFLENRIYQGSSGKVYPHPVIEKIYDIKQDKTYRACFLENRYLKIMILPELGGRVQMAFDKIRQRHFVYYNSVIKPALVGLTGPWISGGIEFNWPQHHRPSTFQPVDSCIEENSDGSKTVWCSEVERMTRTKGMAGFTLYPDKAYLAIHVKLYNRTIFPQSFLWWANPAIKVNDEYQSVFPPDVNAVFDHGKRAVSEFPIAKGTYYKVDYSKGVDISWFKNIPVPTSYMAINSKYDFIGGFEHDSQAGMIHVADHHISPGKKQWTWGNSDFGNSWYRNLTDEDGPYIELMTGVFTDNQPDFSWMMPFEERSFTQYFMPFSEIGLIKNATKEAFVNLEFTESFVTVKLYCTSEFDNAIVVLKTSAEVILRKTINISPETPFIEILAIDPQIKPEELEVTLSSDNGKVLVTWQPSGNVDNPVPSTAEPARDPEDISSIEQLYLTGLHIEQYRHATYLATDYYKEALRREPGDLRNNNAMGLWLLRRGKFTEAEAYFRKTVTTLTARNPNPYDGEPFYNLGWSLKMQGRLDEAYDAFFKSVWNAAWQDAGYLSLAQIATWKGHFEDALYLANQSLLRNWHNHKTRHLKTVILRKLEKYDEAMKFASESIAIDQFNIGCLFEKHLLLTSLSDLSESADALKEMKSLLRGNLHNYIEYALDYSSAGLFSEATSLLSEYISGREEVYPMIYYFLGYFASQAGNSSEVRKNFIEASMMKPDFCFPNRIEEVLTLQDAIRFNPMDAKAYYYLGNFWYSNGQYSDALECWESSLSIDDKFPTVLRNLSLVYYNKQKNERKALDALEKAFSLDQTDSRILMELDQLYKRVGRSSSERLEFMGQNLSQVELRDDLYLERITLYNQLGDFQKAKELLAEHKFHPWEGGEGKVTGQYLLCQVELSKIALGEGRFEDALEFLASAKTYPQNLGEGKLYGTQENDIHYYMGCAYEGLGNNSKAKGYFKYATTGIIAPSQAFFYNDQQSDKIFYQGLAWCKLGNETMAQTCFTKLIKYGENQMFRKIKIDYFAVSLPDMLIWDDDLDRRNLINCYYLIGLGYLGTGDLSMAGKYLQSVLSIDVNHIGAIIHQKMLTQPFFFLRYSNGDRPVSFLKTREK